MLSGEQILLRSPRIAEERNSASIQLPIARKGDRAVGVDGREKYLGLRDLGDGV